MRYSLVITCHKGVPEITEYSNDPDFGSSLPDGSWTIGGNEDEQGNVSINVSRRKPNGQFVSEAQHFRVGSNYRNPDEMENLFGDPERVKATLIAAGFPADEVEEFAMKKFPVGSASVTTMPLSADSGRFRAVVAINGGPNERVYTLAPEETSEGTKYRAQEDGSLFSEDDIRIRME